MDGGESRYKERVVMGRKSERCIYKLLQKLDYYLIGKNRLINRDYNAYLLLNGYDNGRKIRKIVVVMYLNIHYRIIFRRKTSSAISSCLKEKIYQDLINATGADDYYLYRHHIGEIFIYLNVLQKYIRKNESKNPVVIVYDERLMPLYQMFINDLKVIYYPKQLIEIAFPIDIVHYHGHRFFSPTSDCFQKLRADVVKNRRDIHFYSYICESMGIDAGCVLFNKPMISDRTKVSSLEKINAINLAISRFIIICPEATTASKLSSDFWMEICLRFQLAGYDILLNAVSKEYDFLPAKKCDLTIDEIYYMAEQSQGIIALVSGLVALFSQVEIPRYVIYTDQTPTVGCRLSSNELLKTYKLSKIPNCFEKGLYELDVNENSEDAILEMIFKKFEIIRM